jgi:hypothetical protein
MGDGLMGGMEALDGLVALDAWDALDQWGHARSLLGINPGEALVCRRFIVSDRLADGYGVDSTSGHGGLCRWVTGMEVLIGGMQARTDCQSRRG